MKKLLSLMIVAIMVFATFSSAFHICAETVSGACGNNLTWEIDTGTGVLTVSGTGSIGNYSYDTYSAMGIYITTAPWGEYRQVLKQVVIEPGVTSIGTYSFCGLDSLKNVSIPDSVTSIGDDAFLGCISLERFTVPDGVRSIGNSAFSECGSLESAVIGSNVTSIGEAAFCECGSLKSVIFDNCPASISEGAFYHCYSLTSVDLGNSVTSIGDDAFTFCWSLASITIPGSVTSIGDGAFFECTSLSDVFYTGSEDQWTNIEIEDSNEALLEATIHYGPVDCDLIGHNFSADFVIDVQPTRTDSGSRSRHCSRCDAVTDVQTVAYYPGDVNGDGILSLKDLSCLKKMIAGNMAYNMIASVNCDADEDLMITMKDIGRMKSLIAGN